MILNFKFNFLSGNISALFDITFHKIRNAIPWKWYLYCNSWIFSYPLVFSWFHFYYAPESDFPCFILGFYIYITVNGLLYSKWPTDYRMMQSFVCHCLGINPSQTWGKLIVVIVLISYTIAQLAPLQIHLELYGLRFHFKQLSGGISLLCVVIKNRRRNCKHHLTCPTVYLRDVTPEKRLLCWLVVL